MGAKAFRFFLERLGLNFCDFLERHPKIFLSRGILCVTARGSACVVSRTRVSRYIPFELEGVIFTADYY